MTKPPDNASEWSTTVDADGMADRLRRACSTAARARIVILTHAKPDGDAVGATLALARTLGRIGEGGPGGGARPEVWYIGPVPPWVSELVGNVVIRECPPGLPINDESAFPPALVAVVDTGSWSQVAEARAFLTAHKDRVVVIDHHRHGDTDLSAIRLIDQSAASATQVLAPVCCALLGAGTSAALPPDVAEPLYLGLATDTGWLRYSNVTARTLRLAADLRQAGVDHTRLYRILEQQDAVGRWRLLGRALASLQTHPLAVPPDANSSQRIHPGELALMSLSLRDFDDAGAERTDTGGFADMLLAVKSVRVSAILTEGEVANPEGGPLTKISLRSKPGDHPIDVNLVAQKFGGGGHAMAAGARVRMSLSDARRALLEALADPGARA